MGDKDLVKIPKEKEQQQQDQQFFVKSLQIIASYQNLSFVFLRYNICGGGMVPGCWGAHICTSSSVSYGFPPQYS